MWNLFSDYGGGWGGEPLSSNSIALLLVQAHICLWSVDFIMFSDDEYLCHMKMVFITLTGRGQPPKLLPVPLTNKLLLQLEFL